MAAIIQEPGKRPLHGPAPGKHLKSLSFFFRYLQVNFMRLFQVPSPYRQPFGPIASIDPQLPQPLDAPRNIPRQERHQAQAIIGVGRSYHHGNTQPQRIHQQMPFAPLDLLAPVKTHFTPLGRGLAALTIHPASGGLRPAAQATAPPLTQRRPPARPDPPAPPP